MWYGKFVRNISYPISLLRRGELQQLRYLRDFEKSQFASPDELISRQTHLMRDLLTHAQKYCPYYQEIFAKSGFDAGAFRSLDDLSNLPILEKRDIQQHYSRMIAKGWPESDLIPNQTGGSTGMPVPFFLSRDRKASRAAATVRHNRWAGLDIGDSAALIWGAPRDRPAASWKDKIRAALLREPHWLDTSCMTEESMEVFRRELARIRPKVIQAYAGALVLFARWLEWESKEVYRPRSIITSAEVLEDDDRELIERVFRCPVFNRYGCREVSVIASECEAKKGLHVMAEGLYIEVVKPDGPTREGENGFILVTDLLNHAMPLIRYRIGDMGRWAKGDCSCGRTLPRLEQVVGRVTDFLVGHDGRLVSGVFLATYVVAQRPSLGQVQIHQEIPGHLRFKVCPGSGFELDTDLAYLRQAAREYLGPTATAEVETVAEIPRAPSGKFLFSISKAALEFGTRSKK